MSQEDFQRVLFERYAEEDDTCDDEWFEAFFEKAHEYGDPAWIDVDWDRETDCGNSASGDESETLYSFRDGDFWAYWTRSTSNGLQGPFQTHHEAVESLGYEPGSFPPPEPDDEEDDEDDESE